MAVCHPSVKFINKVSYNLMSLLKTECANWNFEIQKPMYERVFYKYTPKPYKVSQYSPGNSFNPINIKPVLNWISKEVPNHSPLMATLMAMFPGQRYPAHLDQFVYSDYSKRLHIPIISKPGNRHVSFHQNEESVWNVQYHIMEEGSLYELSNAELHSAENLSDEWRIHLIVDMAENSLLKNKKDWHSTNYNYSSLNFEIEKTFSSDEKMKIWTLNYIAEEEISKSKLLIKNT
jgi:hypothetical protein